VQNETASSNIRSQHSNIAIDGLCERSCDPTVSSLQSTGRSDAKSSRSKSNQTTTRKSKVVPMQNRIEIAENINSILIDRLDKNVSLQTEILSRMEKMLAVQEEKIDQQEKLGANLVKMMEDRRVDTEHKFEENSKKILEVEKSISNTIVNHLTELRRDQENRHTKFAEDHGKHLENFVKEIKDNSDKIDKRISGVERFVWSAGGVVGFIVILVEFILPFMHSLGK
jgi:hypothetical protein